MELIVLPDKEPLLAPFSRLDALPLFAETLQKCGGNRHHAFHYVACQRYFHGKTSDFPRAEIDYTDGASPCVQLFYIIGRGEMQWFDQQLREALFVVGKWELENKRGGSVQGLQIRDVYDVRLL